MASPTQRSLTPSDVAGLVRASFGDRVRVAGCAPLTGGTYAAVWGVRLDDGRRTVLKVEPPATARLLSYEAGLIEAEADYFRLVGERAPGTPVPEVLHHGRDKQVYDGEWLFTSHLPGTPLPELRGADPAVEDSRVRRELGAAIARVHTITGPHYGYTGARAHAPTWRGAFTIMIDELLADAVDWDVELPPGIADLVAANGEVLEAVDRPALVHFDLWDGNVLATPDENGDLTLSGLVDGERYFYGDPLVDFVSPSLLGHIEDEPDHPFLAGYAGATSGGPQMDAAARRRLTLYRMHMYLVMTVEVPSRGMTADGSRDWRLALLNRELTELARPRDE